MPIKIADIILILFCIFWTFAYIAAGKYIPAVFAFLVGILAYNDLASRSK